MQIDQETRAKLEEEYSKLQKKADESDTFYNLAKLVEFENVMMMLKIKI